MPNDGDNKENPELLNALESIKGLLEQSESKLSAARESLQKAKAPDTKPSKMRLPVSNEPVVPVLDDIVSPAADESEEAEELTLHDIPALDDIPVLDTATVPEPTISPAPPGHSTDEVLAYIDNLQDELEKELRNTLMRTVVNIEAEIKKTLREQLQQVKNRIEQERKN